MTRWTITLLLAFVLTTSTGMSATAQINEQDSLALVALYNTTNGPNWTNNTNWLTGSVSTWKGVTVTEGRVTGLTFLDNQLSGSIPSELGNLTNLTSLKLCYNQLSGPIPPELGNLAKLEALWLYSNQLSGGDPARVGRPIQLERSGS